MPLIQRAWNYIKANGISFVSLAVSLAALAVSIESAEDSDYAYGEASECRYELDDVTDKLKEMELSLNKAVSNTDDLERSIDDLERRELFR